MGGGTPGVGHGARLVSSLLIAGGILGVVSSVPLAARFAQEARPYRAGVAAGAIAVFAWCALKGIDLWRGRAGGYRWAEALFALQVPVFSVARLSYEFSTGISCRILFGHSNRRIGADIGSSLNLLVSPEPQGFMFGINIIAVIVFLYLITADPVRRGLVASREEPGPTAPGDLVV
jgi:hypothetical protein